MANNDEKQKQTPERKEQLHQEEKAAPEQSFWQLPNSLMLGMPLPPPSGTPNSVMREMLDPQIPSAEAEADRLSAGITSGTPNSVMREMGSRLDADFSSIHFHNNSQSIRENEAMGSRAYTRGSNIYFGRGGFNPMVAAHELVHTVQQGAVSGRVGLSVPSGIVQREGGDDKGANPDPKEGSTSKKSVKTASFNGLSVMVDGEWTNAKTAETMVKNAREEARRNSPTTSTTVVEEDPDFQPEPQKGGEVLRDSATGLWVERADEDLFVFIEGQWLAAKEQDSPPKKGPDDDLSGQDLSKNLLDPKDSSLSGEKEIEEESFIEDSAEQDDQASRLPNPRDIFGTGRRWRMSRTAITDAQIDGMVALYKDYTRSHNIPTVFPTSARIVAEPVQKALSAANDAVESASGGEQQKDDGSSTHSSELSVPSRSSSPEPDLITSRSSSPGPGADTSGPMLDSTAEQVPGVLPYGTYHAQGQGWKTQKGHLGNASIVQNIGMGTSAFGRQGVLLNNYKYHVHQSAKDDLPIWDESKWKLPTSGNPVKDSKGNIVSSGEFDPYVHYVAPIAGTALGTFGVGTGLAGMVHGIHDTVRQRQNVAAGASRWDAAQSGLDAVAATSSTMSSAWGLAQSIGNIGHAATSTFGDAVHAIPGLSIVTGAASAASGTIQAIRGRKTRSELNAAGSLLDQISLQQQIDDPDAVLNPGQLTDQDKLRMIMKQGHKTAVFNMWSGGLKAVSGGLTAAAGIASLAGAAPVAAGIQGVTAVLNIARSIFEKVYKSKMRNSIVAEEFNINWDREMKAVRDMIEFYNPKFGIRDKDVRRVILKAHGSTDATRTAAYNTIKLNRAQYLINTATDANNAFHKVADMVIEAMGVHKIDGKNYAAGAAKLLAEKLG